MFATYFADLHIHIGRDRNGKPVKITASPQLTLTNILKEASRRKGIDIVGIIDCQAPAVQEEMEQLIEQKVAKELEGGGISFEKVTLIMGAEIEVYDTSCQGPIHVLCYFPTLENMKQFSQWLSTKMKNIHLSSQRFYGTARELQKKVKELSGLFIPAHVFTPFKSVYGKGVTTSITEVLDPMLIDAIELGLSADTEMADQIKELHAYSFVTNSDSHSLPKIAREYQQYRLKEPTFHEIKLALKNQKQRTIVANYGLQPKLGKYHQTVCQQCMNRVTYGTVICPTCHAKKVIPGVLDRIEELKNVKSNPSKRPPYIYQVPLEYLPGLGIKTLEKLLTNVGTEMDVIHKASLDQLKEVVSKDIAEMILSLRTGTLLLEAGGGGKYGKVCPSSKK